MRRVLRAVETRVDNLVMENNNEEYNGNAVNEIREVFREVKKVEDRHGERIGGLAEELGIEQSPLNLVEEEDPERRCVVC